MRDRTASVPIKVRAMMLLGKAMLGADSVSTQVAGPCELLLPANATVTHCVNSGVENQKRSHCLWNLKRSSLAAVPLQTGRARPTPGRSLPGLEPSTVRSTEIDRYAHRKPLRTASLES